jgi:hypothetical protein
MARIYGYYCPTVRALEVQRNCLAQTLQMDGTPKRVKQFLHTLHAREEKTQPACHANERIEE